MFAVFLKAKQEIHAKLSQLQRIYLALMSLRVRPLEFNTTNDSDAASEIIREKLENLLKIRDEYERVHHQCLTTAKTLTEARETGEIIEQFINELFAVLRIEIPSSIIEEFATEDSEASHENSSSTLANTLEEDKENSRSYQEEEDEVSDKENEYGSNPSPDSEYFSPNVLISKSTSGNVSCYTPAIKSHSKLPINLSIAKLRKLQL